MGKQRGLTAEQIRYITDHKFLFAPGEMGERKTVDILSKPDIERLK